MCIDHRGFEANSRILGRRIVNMVSGNVAVICFDGSRTRLSFGDIEIADVAAHSNIISQVCRLAGAAESSPADVPLVLRCVDHPDAEGIHFPASHLMTYITRGVQHGCFGTGMGSTGLVTMRGDTSTSQAIEHVQASGVPSAMKPSKKPKGEEAGDAKEMSAYDQAKPHLLRWTPSMVDRLSEMPEAAKEAPAAKSKLGDLTELEECFILKGHVAGLKAYIEAVRVPVVFLTLRYYT